MLLLITQASDAMSRRVARRFALDGRCDYPSL